MKPGLKRERRFSMVKKLGIVARLFSAEPGLVDKNVKMMLKLIEAFALVKKTHSEIAVLDIVIPTNPDFVDVDCGKTEQALWDAVGEVDWIRISTTQCGLFCGLLNETMTKQRDEGCTHSLVVSSGCADYVTDANIANLVAAAEAGALVTGLALNELHDSIMAGRIPNTFAVWRLEELFGVGGFDLRMENALRAKPTKLTGVEEMIPQLKLVRQHGKCLMPIEPVSAAVWNAPTDAAGAQRHKDKMGSKLVRQEYAVNLEGGTLDEIRAGVMNN